MCPSFSITYLGFVFYECNITDSCLTTLITYHIALTYTSNFLYSVTPLNILQILYCTSLLVAVPQMHCLSPLCPTDQTVYKLLVQNFFSLSTTKPIIVSSAYSFTLPLLCEDSCKIFHRKYTYMPTVIFKLFFYLIGLRFL